MSSSVGPVERDRRRRYRRLTDGVSRLVTVGFGIALMLGLFTGDVWVAWSLVKPYLGR